MMTENEYQHEIVKPDNGLPARYFLSNDGRPAMVPMHYHDAIEIMYCTRGCVTLTKGSEAILLQEGDVVQIRDIVLEQTEVPVENISIVSVE